MQRLSSPLAAVLTAVYMTLTLGVSGAHQHGQGQTHPPACPPAGLHAGHCHTAIDSVDQLPAAGHSDCPACWLEQHAQPASLPAQAFVQPCFAAGFSAIAPGARPERQQAHSVLLAHPATGPPATGH